ncbi:MAG: hypothetical protein JWP26_876 [Devosia sp.]|uniref:hypothetical protein n=1 Tax=Devosia sp. TaxID=1871048 RepID=UPI002630EFB8|nr:hypothetical protein [Devosia sp.]MDB5585906.1 hypothetical protein [Devosia sp.]
MLTYASKYVEITNMTSPIKADLESDLRIAALNKTRRTKLLEHEFIVEFQPIWHDKPLEHYPLDNDQDTQSGKIPQFACEGMGKNRTVDQILYRKIVAWRTDNMDVASLIPNFEPEICLFVFQDFTFHNSPDFLEMYVREDYLQSSQGHKFAQFVLRAKLKGEVI